MQHLIWLIYLKLVVSNCFLPVFCHDVFLLPLDLKECTHGSALTLCWAALITLMRVSVKTELTLTLILFLQEQNNIIIKP